MLKFNMKDMKKTPHVFKAILDFAVMLYLLCYRLWCFKHLLLRRFMEKINNSFKKVLRIKGPFFQASSFQLLILYALKTFIEIVDPFCCRVNKVVTFYSGIIKTERSSRIRARPVSLGIWWQKTEKKKHINLISFQQSIKPYNLSPI